MNPTKTRVYLSRKTILEKNRAKNRRSHLELHRVINDINTTKP